jgi:hypothetical protein
MAVDDEKKGKRSHQNIESARGKITDEGLTVPA